jgi:hypothetical protein
MLLSIEKTLRFNVETFLVKHEPGVGYTLSAPLVTVLFLPRLYVFAYESNRYKNVTVEDERIRIICKTRTCKNLRVNNTINTTINRFVVDVDTRVFHGFIN